MEKIIRFRNTQPITLDGFIEEVLDKPSCKYCQYIEECTENMGQDVLECIGDSGCSAFDNSINGLKEIYLKKYCLTPANI
jgi:hypothetical protein